MPYYTTLCPGCQRRGFVVRRIADRNLPIPACTCGEVPARILDRPMVAPDIPSYVSPATGEVVGSRSARREDLRKSGYIEWEPGMREAIERKRKERYDEALQVVDRRVDEVVRDFAASGRLNG